MMEVRAHLMMVMSLDKCIGCHTCSIGCKQAWTNRDGTDYMWWNNVECKPGAGYPKRWQDQAHWKGGWNLDKNGRLRLRAGGRGIKLATIFGNFDLPLIDDYYEPWTYDYGILPDQPFSDGPPVVSARSRLTGKPIDLEWGPDWEDDLAGVRPGDDPAAVGLEREVFRAYRDVFLFHLPRICNHCINPSCVASCPSGAMYKRASDGVVLVDQDRCRGWRFCVSGCPYKKVYFNALTSKAEKCIFCYAGVTEDGMPTICSETCVGRIRYIGVVLYDLEAVTEAAETRSNAGLVDAQRALFLDPHDARVISEAERAGIAYDWIEAAKRSPVYALAKDMAVALPLHPEFRTLPMIWYVPPLSPLLESGTMPGASVGERSARDSEGGTSGEIDPSAVFGPIERMRIPVQYLANILAAGDTVPVRDALGKLAAMRAYKRRQHLTGRGQSSLADHAQLTVEQLEHLYRLLGPARKTDRYVIPKTRLEDAGALQTQFHRKAEHRDRGRRPWQ